jgi:hypothetical protein
MLVTCAVLSEAYEREALKSEVFLNGINCSKKVVGTWKMVKEVVVQGLTEPMKMLKECGI